MKRQLSEDHIHSLFSNHGSVLSVHFPKAVAEGSRIKPRRFAFVWMKTTTEATTAMNAINGRAISVSDLGVKLEDDIKPDSGRTVAVDYALPKDAWERSQQTETAPAGSRIKWKPEDDEMSEDSKEEDDSDSDEVKDEEDEDEDVSMRDNSSRSEESEGDADSNSEDDEGASHLPKPEEGTTLFVRNLPFEATEDDLGEL